MSLNGLVLRSMRGGENRRNYLPEKDRYLSSVPDPIFTFNIIGLGVNGLEHLRNTFHEGRAVVKGVYDIEPLSVAAARDEYRKFVPDRELVSYDTLEKCCTDPEVDALIIATPNFSHIDIIREIAQYKKPLLLEKPMATTVKDAWEIVTIAENYPALFQIGLQYRYKAMYAEAIYEAKERKTIGEIKTISITEHRVPFFDKVKQWNKFAKYSGDTLVEKCCHYFDLFNLFAESKPAKVYASGSMAVNFKDFTYDGEPSDILDNAMVIVDYENGVRANFNLCMFSPLFYEAFTLCGDTGWLSAYHKNDYLKGSPTTELQILSSDLKPARTMIPEYPGAIETFGHDGATFFEHMNFVDNLLCRQTNTATVLEGFWAVVVGAAAQKSIVTGEVVIIKDFLSDEKVEIGRY
jgi:myo-inositol 2-dehydrogenase / D-chiro-inositol 1-dehydrogenase